jgi:hypothetical protein
MSTSPDLWDPEAHEPLAGRRWDEGRARRAIAEIAADTADALGGGGDQTLYFGAAGAIWALAELDVVDGDWTAAARDAYDAYLLAPDTGEVVPSLLAGQVGILLLCAKLAPDERTLHALEELIRSNIANPDVEVVRGAAGTMRAALHLLEWTGEDRWAALWTASADAIWDLWRYDPDAGAHVWATHRHGELTHLVGAAKGIAGNVAALWAGRELLSERRREELVRHAVAAARALAVEADGLVNWPRALEDPELVVQWCHGAPGVIQSLWRLPAQPGLDDLLLRAGRLVWQAGPPAKGPGLCHGTSGNGWALLALHARTGDPLWLGRARDFAMHALAQLERQAVRRLSLWTGDVGVALYLRACIDADPRWPTLDRF